MKKNTLYTALIIYAIFSFITLLSWQLRSINTITGDEPHYLVISSGIVKQGTLEQTVPYKEEFKDREIYKHGLAAKDAQPSAENTHAILGPNGLYNVHNIGLPILLALPFFFGGVAGAKIMMLIFGSFIVVLAWRFSSFFSENKVHRLCAVIAATISIPLIPASNQIYPDILAGLISLTGLYWFFTIQNRRTSGLEALLIGMIAFLPWLQIKFAATCIILLISISLKIYFQSNNYRKIILILLITASSFIALAAYNYYAFGKISGPYLSSALEISKTSLMVLIGLHIDQNQGFILQNPINLIGILAVGWMYKINPKFAIVWALVFLSLIVPNAMHPAWYGGWSFSGRFQWAAAIVFIAPTLLGLLIIAKNKENIFKTIVVSAAILQIYFFFQYTIYGVNLYNKGTSVFFDSYSIFYYPVHGLLPMLYDSSFAYEYLPNYFWITLVLCLLFFGFSNTENLTQKFMAKKNLILIISVFFHLIIAAYSPNIKIKNEHIFQASQLPSQTGSAADSNRLAKSVLDKPGFVNYGPYFPLRKGNYEVLFSYKSTALPSEVVGWIDVYDATSRSQLIKIPINGTNGTTIKNNINFQPKHWSANSYEFRTYWNGLSDIEIHNIYLKSN